MQGSDISAYFWSLDWFFKILVKQEAFKNEKKT